MSLPIRKYALISEDNIVLYIETFSLDSEESFLGNYAGAVFGIAIDDRGDVEVGMYWDTTTDTFYFK